MSIKLTLTKISEHKSMQDALGEAKHFVSLPREVSKNEANLLKGQKLVIKSNDPSRRNLVTYEVLVGERVEEVKEVVKEVRVGNENHTKALEYIFNQLGHLQREMGGMTSEEVEGTISMMKENTQRIANGEKPGEASLPNDDETVVAAPGIKISKARQQKRK